MTLRARLSFLIFPMVALASFATLLDTRSFIPNHLLHKAHPGYHEQWFNDKKDANGEIPPFLRSQWAKYDAMKFNLSRRSSDNPIDTIIELGPKSVGGRTRGLWIDPRNEKIMLAGGGRHLRWPLAHRRWRPQLEAPQRTPSLHDALLHHLKPLQPR